ncbi:MAG TPA: hypothetical protein VGN97_17315 [Mesorhizobium sp.]|jgi:antitoxin (DNA-binding transcriptional repressor) of toxin-antitoxin stability system|nr:hypothetical protein [Mesorhizobium sp.]
MAETDSPRRWTVDVTEGEEKLEGWIDALQRGEVDEVVLTHQGRTAAKLIACEGETGRDREDVLQD